MHKADGNASAIITGLQRAGCSVEAIQGVEHRWGHKPGVPDLLALAPRKRSCGCRLMFLIEIKREGKPLTAAQVHWQQTWGGPVYRVETLEQALEAVGILPTRATA